MPSPAGVASVPVQRRPSAGRRASRRHRSPACTRAAIVRNRSVTGADGAGLPRCPSATCLARSAGPSSIDVTRHEAVGLRAARHLGELVLQRSGAPRSGRGPRRRARARPSRPRIAAEDREHAAAHRLPREIVHARPEGRQEQQPGEVGVAVGHVRAAAGHGETAARRRSRIANTGARSSRRRASGRSAIRRLPSTTTPTAVPRRVGDATVSGSSVTTNRGTPPADALGQLLLHRSRRDRGEPDEVERDGRDGDGERAPSPSQQGHDATVITMPIDPGVAHDRDQQIPAAANGPLATLGRVQAQDRTEPRRRRRRRPHDVALALVRHEVDATSPVASTRSARPGASPHRRCPTPCSSPARGRGRPVGLKPTQRVVQVREQLRDRHPVLGVGLEDAVYAAVPDERLHQEVVVEVPELPAQDRDDDERDAERHVVEADRESGVVGDQFGQAVVAGRGATRWRWARPWLPRDATRPGRGGACGSRCRADLVDRARRRGPS